MHFMTWATLIARIRYGAVVLTVWPVPGVILTCRKLGSIPTLDGRTSIEIKTKKIDSPFK